MILPDDVGASSHLPHKMAVTSLCHFFGRSPIFDNVFLYDKQNLRVGSAHHSFCLAYRV